MNSAAGPSEVKNPETGMSHTEMKEFIRNHFEEFVNRKNLRIGEVNFAPSFVDHGADVPPGLPPGPEGAIQYVGAALKKVPDLRVTIEDIVAEDDKVVVRNHWIGTDTASKQRLEFSGIVIWRIANRQIMERWAYLETPHPARGQA
jgi:predicted SnoaL-like aldol condensation-catalyzing enzyme